MAENFFAMIDRVKRNIRKNAKNPEAMIEALELALIRGREDFNADPVGATLESANLGGLSGLVGMTKSSGLVNQDALERAYESLKSQVKSKGWIDKTPVDTVFKNPLGVIDRNIDAAYSKAVDLPTEKINVESIVPTQKFLNFKNLKDVKDLRSIPESDSITVVEQNGKFYLTDGHHRVANAILGGSPEILAKVFRVSPKMLEKNNASVKGLKGLQGIGK